MPEVKPQEVHTPYVLMTVQVPADYWGQVTVTIKAGKVVGLSETRTYDCKEEPKS